MQGEGTDSGPAFVARYRDDLPIPVWDVGHWETHPCGWDWVGYGIGDTEAEAWGAARRLGVRRPTGEQMDLFGGKP